MTLLDEAKREAPLRAEPHPIRSVAPLTRPYAIPLPMFHHDQSARPVRIAFCEPLFIESSHSASECLHPAIISFISIQLAITRRAAARYLNRFRLAQE